MIDIQNGRVNGWLTPTKEELLKLSVITPLNHFNQFCISNWIWPDYPEGEPVYFPAEYTPEQLETLRNDWIKAEIEKIYSHDIQLKILTEKEENPEVYEQLQTDRARIKLESKEIDFQIKIKSLGGA